jgi:hypothetical protein
MEMEKTILDGMGADQEVTFNETHNLRLLNFHFKSDYNRSFQLLSNINDDRFLLPKVFLHADVEFQQRFSTEGIVPGVSSRTNLNAVA